MSSNNHSRLPKIQTFKGNRKKFELLRVKLYGTSSEGKANYHYQRAKKVVPDSPELVDFVIGLVKICF